MLGAAASSARGFLWAPGGGACEQCLIDPVAACPGPLAVGLQHAALVGAYVTLVGAFWAGVDVDVTRLAVLRLPRRCRMQVCAEAFVRAAEARRAAVAGGVPEVPYAWPVLHADMDVLTGERVVHSAPLPRPCSWPLVEGSDDEVWLQGDPDFCAAQDRSWTRSAPCEREADVPCG